jgi:hypothetical protein
MTLIITAWDLVLGAGAICHERKQIRAISNSLPCTRLVTAFEGTWEVMGLPCQACNHKSNDTPIYETV